MRLAAIARLPRRAGRYAWHTWKHARAAARKHKISTFRIVREQVALKRANGLSVEEYYRYGLDAPAVPWEEKMTYLGADRIRALWTVFTPERYQHYFKNKFIFKHFFSSMGFPVAKHYGILDPVYGYTVTGEPFKTPADLAAWMSASDVQDPVFKPMESAEGRMVLVMKGRQKGDPSRFVSASGEKYTPERIFAFISDDANLREAYPPTEYARPIRTILVEQRLHQHPALKEVAPHTLCCARLVTVTTLDGRVEIVERAMKLTLSDQGMDNVIQGSVAVAIDMESGVLGAGRLKTDPFQCRRTHFPDSSIKFTGFQLPLWEEAKDLAVRAALAFPHAHSVGWDIAFTENGPFLVEGNASWGAFQRTCRTGLWQGAYRETVERLLAQQGKKWPCVPPRLHN